LKVNELSEIKEKPLSDLMNEIVTLGLCTVYSTCIAVCLYNVLIFEKKVSNV